jgi:hypothetical protein
MRAAGAAPSQKGTNGRLRRDRRMQASLPRIPAEPQPQQVGFDPLVIGDAQT